MSLEIIHEMFPDERPTLEKVLERTKDTMKAYIISLTNDHDSTVATRRLLISIKSFGSNIEPFIFDAVTPKNMSIVHERFFGKSTIKKVEYTYPLEGQTRYDMRTGLELSGYPTKDINKRISCFLSHYTLWKNCIQANEPIMILEQDALFTKTFDYSLVKDRFTGDIMGLNNPMMATRRAKVYDKGLSDHWKQRYPDVKTNQPTRRIPPVYDVFEAPWVDNNRMVPQGIAGNSAYIIKPEGAEKLIALTAENGIWPNDAIMCKQLMPGKLQHLYPYVTKVQGGRSTTSE
jgi:glycosyl transferase family 25